MPDRSAPASSPWDPWFLPTPSDLHDYGAIGNLHTAALVSRWGSIDWACLPRFASPSVFARILDSEKGGFHLVRPVGRANPHQEYVPGTNVLRTVFELEGSPTARRLEVTDLMPVRLGERGEGLPAFLRRVEAHGGPVECVSVLRPAFDYARVPAHAERVGRAIHLRGGDQEICYRINPSNEPFPLEIGEEGVVTGTFTVKPGPPIYLEILTGGADELGEPPGAVYQETIAFWRDWVGRIPLPLDPHHRRWHAWIERSLLALKLLSHCDTGAFVAAPTTSLPEWPGEGRNWDYRYAWIRDAAFAAQAFLSHGHPEEAIAFLNWVVARVRQARSGVLRVVYGVHGETDLTEKELPHLSGFLGSRPVRIGNGAAEQFQLDIYGELLDAAALLAEMDPQAVAPLWPDLSALADEVMRLWKEPDRGIWEVRGPPAHYVHSKLMAWVALDRSAKLAWRFSGERTGDRWSSEAERIREEILHRGVDPKTGAFVQAYGRHVPDAANLRIPIAGLLPYSDPRVQATVEQVMRELAEGPFVYRYKADDGLAGPEGTFLPCSFWLLECLARGGRPDQAVAFWEQLLRTSGPLMLFSEEYHPQGDRALGNYPQAFTHIEVLRASRALAEMGAPHDGPPPHDRAS